MIVENFFSLLFVYPCKLHHLSHLFKGPRYFLICFHVVLGTVSFSASTCVGVLQPLHLLSWVVRLSYVLFFSFFFFYFNTLFHAPSSKGRGQFIGLYYLSQLSIICSFPIGEQFFGTSWSNVNETLTEIGFKTKWLTDTLWNYGFRGRNMLQTFLSQIGNILYFTAMINVLITFDQVIQWTLTFSVQRW